MGCMPFETVVVGNRWRCGFEHPDDKKSPFFKNSVSFVSDLDSLESGMIESNYCGHLNIITDDDIMKKIKDIDVDFGSGEGCDFQVTCEKYKQKFFIYDVYDENV